MGTPRLEERFLQVLEPYKSLLDKLSGAADRSMELKRTIANPADVRLDISNRELPFLMRLGTSSAELTQAQDGLREALDKIGVIARVAAEVPDRKAMDSTGRLVDPSVVDAIISRRKAENVHLNLREGDYSRVVQLPDGSQQSLYEALAERWFSNRGSSLHVAGATYVPAEQLAGRDLISRARRAANKGWLDAPLTDRMKDVFFPNTANPKLHRIERAVSLTDWRDGEMSGYTGPVIALSRYSHSNVDRIVGMGDFEDGESVEGSEMFVKRDYMPGVTDIRVQLPEDFPGGHRLAYQYGTDSRKSQIWFLTPKAQAR